MKYLVIDRFKNRKFIANSDVAFATADRILHSGTEYIVAAVGPIFEDQEEIKLIIDHESRLLDSIVTKSKSHKLTELFEQ